MAFTVFSKTQRRATAFGDETCFLNLSITNLALYQLSYAAATICYLKSGSCGYQQLSILF